MDLTTFSNVSQVNYPVGFNENICHLRYCEGYSRKGGKIFFSLLFLKSVT